MPQPKRTMLDKLATPITLTHVTPDATLRPTAEAFIREVFAEHYQARVSSFAPTLTLFEQATQLVAAAGWRSAGDEALFLERYLDAPIEHAVAQLAGQQVTRDRIVEVGNLATTRQGSSVHVIFQLAEHFHRSGFEWVVFTATHELVRIFTRLGLPLLALAPADPSRLGDEAAAWGSYYDTRPVVVAGRIRLGLERIGKLEVAA